MPHIESEVSDFGGSTCFAGLYLPAAYGKLPLHPESYELCGIFTPQRVIVSPRALQGLANSTSHFQPTGQPLYSELLTNMKACLDDFQPACP